MKLDYWCTPYVIDALKIAERVKRDEEAAWNEAADAAAARKEYHYAAELQDKAEYARADAIYFADVLSHVKEVNESIDPDDILAELDEILANL